MRILHLPVVALVLGVGGVALAQAPGPFGPDPDFSRRARCSSDYVRSVETLATALEKLRTAGPEALGRLCALVETGRAWLGGELPEDVRRELRGLLGVDVDLERIAQQCRAGQDGIGRELADKLRQLRAELIRCDGTI